MTNNDVVLAVCRARLVDALLNRLSPTTHLQDVQRWELIVCLDSEHNTVHSCSWIIELIMLVLVDFHTLIVLFQWMVEAGEARRFSQHLSRLFCWKRWRQRQGLLTLWLCYLLSGDYNRCLGWIQGWVISFVFFNLYFLEGSIVKWVMRCALTAQLPYLVYWWFSRFLRTGIIGSDDGQEWGITHDSQVCVLLFTCIFKDLNIGSFNLLLRVHLWNFLRWIRHFFRLFYGFVLHIRCSVYLVFAI